MLNAVLKKYSPAARISIKGAISLLCITLAVALPQIAHAAGGAQAGAVWMPMYAPALLAGCLLGWQWGLGVGLLSPIVSMGFTYWALGSAMPAAERLPYMVAEIGLNGLICGLFASRIEKNAYVAFPAVALAQVAGRGVYVVWNLIAGKSFSYLISSVQTGLCGMFVQLIAVPLIAVILCKALYRERT